MSDVENDKQHVEKECGSPWANSANEAMTDFMDAARTAFWKPGQAISEIESELDIKFSRQSRETLGLPMVTFGLSASISGYPLLMATNAWKQIAQWHCEKKR